MRRSDFIARLACNNLMVLGSFFTATCLQLFHEALPVGSPSGRDGARAGAGSSSMTTGAAHLEHPPSGAAHQYAKSDVDSTPALKKKDRTGGVAWTRQYGISDPDPAARPTPATGVGGTATPAG